jgi:hypothetical protein
VKYKTVKDWAIVYGLIALAPILIVWLGAAAYWIRRGN